MSKNTQKDALTALAEWSIDDEIDRLTKLSTDELDKELREEGEDVEALAAQAKAWREKHLRNDVAATGGQSAVVNSVSKEAPSARALPTAAEARKVVALAPRRRNTRVWVGLLAACFVGALTTATIVRMNGPNPVPQADEVALLRQQAVSECNARKWAACVAHLDEAARRDPASITTALRDLRGRAAAQLANPDNGRFEVVPDSLPTAPPR